MQGGRVGGGTSAYAVAETLQQVHLAIACKEPGMGQDQCPVGCLELGFQHGDCAPDEDKEVLPVAALWRGGVGAKPSSSCLP